MPRPRTAMILKPQPKLRLLHARRRITYISVIVACIACVFLIPHALPASNPVAPTEHVPKLSKLVAQAKQCGFNLEIPSSALSVKDLAVTRTACSLRQPRAKDVTVVTSTDLNFMERLPTFLRSIAAHNRRHVYVSVLTTVVDDDQLRTLCGLIEHLPSISLDFYSLSVEQLQDVFSYTRQEGTTNVLPHVTITTMMRLLAPVILPHNKVVYLDLDVLIRAELSQLYNGHACKPRDRKDRFLQRAGICAKNTINDNLAGWMRPDWRCVFGIEDSKKFGQFNAGVMVLDLEYMRQQQAVEYAIVLSNTFSLNDQSILNLFADGVFDEMDPNLNVYYGQDSDKFSTKNAILHSAGSKKPWLSAGHEWSELWLAYESVGHLFVWTSSLDPPSAHDLVAVRSAVANSNGRHVLAFCGNRKCMEQIGEVHGVQVVRFRLRDFLASPMAPWFRDHPVRKVIHGVHFEKHLLAAARLAVLYHYGGLLHDGKMTVERQVPDEAMESKRPWCYVADGSKQSAQEDEGVDPAPPTAIFAPRQDPRVLDAIKEFMATAPTYMRGDAWPVDWTRNWLNACPSRDQATPFDAGEFLAAIPGSDRPPPKRLTKDRPSFGAIWYDERSKYLASVGNHAVNLGDEVQSLASLQWLPFMEHKIERDRLVTPKGAKSNVTVIINAWYGTPTMVWPPQGKYIDPVPVAVHIEPKRYEQFSTPESLAYLKARQPIGSRDMATLDFLQKYGVSTYFSACMTTTLSMPKIVTEDVRKKGDCGILFVDVNRELINGVFPERVMTCGTEASPKWRDLDGSQDNLEGVLRFQNAFELLKTYSRAKVIVTSRLHTALPSASMGVPVVLVLTDSMPGGGGKSDGNQRFAGLSGIIHSISVSKGKIVSASSKMKNFDWDNPPPNPGAPGIQKLRCSLLGNISRSHPHLRESIETFFTHPRLC